MFVQMEDVPMRRSTLTLLVLFFTILFSAQAQKKRVAVMNFDYATVKTTVAQLFGSDQDVGKGIADMLVDRLVNDGTYSVIERKELDKIVAEQNFSNSDRADPASAAKLARILGVNAIIIGSITQFGNDNSTTKVGGGALGGVTGRFGIGGASKSKSTAVVQITARMIDTSTAEILASTPGKGEASRGGVGLLGSGGSAYGPSAGAGIDMKSSGFQNTILGEATNQAVTQVAQALVTKAASLPTVTVEISGMVADAAPDGTLILNVGAKNGVKVGDTLNVKRKVREVRDPDTGKVLRSVEDSVGTVTITEVEASSSVGKFHGAGTPQVKDTVGNK
jgi:curli biogenesis system outer membrane secretion channel CsgG